MRRSEAQNVLEDLLSIVSQHCGSLSFGTDSRWIDRGRAVWIPVGAILPQGQVCEGTSRPGDLHEPHPFSACKLHGLVLGLLILRSNAAMWTDWLMSGLITVEAVLFSFWLAGVQPSNPPIPLERTMIFLGAIAGTPIFYFLGRVWPT